MKRFIIIAEQSGGCDYTIGCGIKFWFESAKSLDDLKKEIKSKFLGDVDDYDGNYLGRVCTDPSHWGSEYSYDNLTIYELSDNSFSFNINDLAKEIKERKSKEIDLEKEKEERAKYEELKAKFEKAEPKDVTEECSVCKNSFEPKDKETMCLKCKKEYDEEMKKKTKIALEINTEKNKLIKLLIEDGWEKKYLNFITYFIKDKYRISLNYGEIEIWDLMLPGKRKPTWRRGDLVEIASELSDETLKFIEESSHPLLK